MYDSNVDMVDMLALGTDLVLCGWSTGVQFPGVHCLLPMLLMYQ